MYIEKQWTYHSEQFRLLKADFSLKILESDEN